MESSQLSNDEINDEIFDFEQLKNLRNKIEKLPQEQHNEILKMLCNDDKLNFTENKSGTFVNLTDASLDTLKKLSNYIIHLEDQEQTLFNLCEQQQQNKYYSTK